ncbi:MAG: hypothetical protein R3208_20715 [Ketobacteraceae bacterium]|nr:hypothetical protein [Ketobacteraceae bacterium]
MHHSARLFLRTLLVSLFLFGLAGCGGNDAPDQDLFPSMVEMTASDGWYEDAFARLYKSPIPDATTFTHPWLVLKKPNSWTLIVVEVRENKGAPADPCDPMDPDDLTVGYAQSCGHVYMETRTAEYADRSYYYSRKNWAMAELRGPEAEPVVSFALEEWGNYKCRHTYNYLGINSNTYIRSILESTGWNAFMGSSSWGQQFWKRCTDIPEQTPLMLAASQPE